MLCILCIILFSPRASYYITKTVEKAFAKEGSEGYEHLEPGKKGRPWHMPSSFSCLG
jgi:hypothetical protein